MDIQVQETRGEDGSYKYAFSYERATLYEFKYERKPHPDPVDPCYRCYRRIWDKEQMINVGVLYHKACFRCRICGLPLTMQTFYRNDANGSPDREVYCKTHVGKGINQIQQERAVIEGLENGVAPDRTDTVGSDTYRAFNTLLTGHRFAFAIMTSLFFTRSQNEPRSCQNSQKY